MKTLAFWHSTTEGALYVWGDEVGWQRTNPAIPVGTRLFIGEYAPLPSDARDERMFTVRVPSEPVYKVNEPTETQWCNSHRRRALYLLIKPTGEVEPCCGPNQSGICLPCFCVRLNGIAEIEETV